MTKLEKLIETFLSNPRKLKYNDIEKILISANFELKWWKWSHRKIINPKDNSVYIVSVHNWDCLRVYKEDLKEIYINNLK